MAGTPGRPTAAQKRRRRELQRSEALHELLLTRRGGEIGLYPAEGGGWVAIIRSGGGDNVGADGRTAFDALAALAALNAPMGTQEATAVARHSADRLRAERAAAVDAEAALNAPYVPDGDT